MSCAHSFGEWCSECIDGMVRQFNALRRDHAELQARLSQLEGERDRLRRALTIAAELLERNGIVRPEIDAALSLQEPPTHQPGGTMSRTECRVCKRGPTDTPPVSVFRQNAVGVLPAVWACREHNGVEQDADVLEIVVAIESEARHEQG